MPKGDSKHRQFVGYCSCSEDETDLVRRSAREVGRNRERERQTKTQGGRGRGEQRERERETRRERERETEREREGERGRGGGREAGRERESVRECVKCSQSFRSLCGSFCAMHVSLLIYFV